MPGFRLVHLCHLASGRDPPEEHEATYREQKVYISGCFGGESHYRPHNEQNDCCDDSEVHSNFVDGKFVRP